MPDLSTHNYHTETPKRPPQTLKERTFAKEYPATGNATEAAMRAYDCSTRDSARSLGAQTLAKLSMANLLRDAGIDEQTIITTLQQGLHATRTHKSGEGTLTTQPDFYVRHRYLETAIKLLDRQPAERIEQTGDVKIRNLQELLASLEGD